MVRFFDTIRDIDILAPPDECIKGLPKAFCENLVYSFGSVLVVDDNGNRRMVTAYNLQYGLQKIGYGIRICDTT